MEFSGGKIMSENKRYYYLKLKDNFFDRPEIKAIEAIPNGYEYICIMQKMYLRSLSRNGKLMLTDTIPYKPDILSSVLGHRIEVVSAAIDLFKQFDLLVILSDSTIYMTEIQNFIGQSSTEGDRKRLSRKEIDDHQLLLSGQMSDKRPPEIERELDIERELKKDKKKKDIFVAPTPEQVTEYGKDSGYNIDGKFICRYYDPDNTGTWIDSTGKKVKNWKQKVLSVWCKDEKRINTPQSNFQTTNPKWAAVLDWMHSKEYSRIGMKALLQNREINQREYDYLIELLKQEGRFNG